MFVLPTILANRLVCGIGNDVQQSLPMEQSGQVLDIYPLPIMHVEIRSREGTVFGQPHLSATVPSRGNVDLTRDQTR